jgi:hypothetical protein
VPGLLRPPGVPGTARRQGVPTFRGAGHSNYFGDSRTINTLVDWMRWSLYDDTAARNRLRAGATSSTTTWESALS